MKRAVAVFVAAIFLTSTAFADTLHLKIDESRIIKNSDIGFVDHDNPSVTPKIVGDRTLVPVRVIAEGFGFDVAWDENTQTVSLSNTQSLVTLQIGNKEIISERAGVITKLETDVAPQLIDSRTYLPLRIVAESVLGKEVTWYDESRIICIADAGETYYEDIQAQFAPATFNLKNYPKTDCSTATIPFVNALNKRMLGIGNTAAEKLTKSSKTHGAYVKLISGECDIIFVTEPSPDELELAKQAGVELEVQPFATEGFVFLTHKSNPVNSLTAEQVQGIYEGKITNWSEVGGADEEIIAYQRNPNSGSQTIMESLVMKDKTLMKPPTNDIIYGMGELIEAVANYQNEAGAIGYSVYYYANEMIKNPDVKLLEINGIPPTPQTIQAKLYPFTVSYYAVTIKGRTNTDTQTLLQWVLSDDGQELVSKSGYVKK